MKCPHCNATSVVGRRRNIMGVRVVMIICGSCQKVLGAVNGD